MLYQLSYLHAWRRAGVEPATSPPFRRRGPERNSRRTPSGRACTEPQWNHQDRDLRLVHRGGWFSAAAPITR